MSEFFFVLKTLIFSLAILFVLQMRMGDRTLEERSENWIYRSAVGIELQSVSRGAVKAGEEGWEWFKAKVAELTATKSDRK